MPKNTAKDTLIDKTNPPVFLAIANCLSASCLASASIFIAFSSCSWVRLAAKNSLSSKPKLLSFTQVSASVKASPRNNRDLSCLPDNNHCRKFSA